MTVGVVSDIHMKTSDPITICESHWDVTLPQLKKKMNKARSSDNIFVIKIS